jgi:hypothetical protein
VVKDRLANARRILCTLDEQRVFEGEREADQNCQSPELKVVLGGDSLGTIANQYEPHRHSVVRHGHQPDSSCRVLQRDRYTHGHSRLHENC